ncbi:hypothetical protein D5400_11620 [Georhizobium profundi]|uniref:HTH cro/C1-type domain-containing protein n=2 Tax=Georhizobium profundi TaxID=2341112 RepID=A0A3Q8XQP6_9HYPH|nr:hypothetical protein D5400_11620 [Georhizobium profundi]
MYRVVENVRRKHLEWVNAILDFKDWKRARLSREAGINPSTLTKFVNDTSGTATLSTEVIEKIAAVGGIPPFERKPPAMQRGLAEDEATHYDLVIESRDSAGTLRKMLVELKSMRNGIDPWILRSRGLETAGYLPGDVLVVDMNATPSNGDVVCAQVMNAMGQAEILFRVYEHPFLVAASMDNSLRRPLLVDNERVQIKGVVVTMMRERSANAA